MLAAITDTFGCDTPGVAPNTDVPMFAIAALTGRELPRPVPLITGDHMRQRKDALMTEGDG